MKEADITISGAQLSEGQSMTVRVALGTFANVIRSALDKGNSDDQTARLHKDFLACLDEINELMRKTCQQEGK